MELFIRIIVKAALAYVALSFIWILRQPVRKAYLKQDTDETNIEQAKIRPLSKEQAENIMHVRKSYHSVM